MRKSTIRIVLSLGLMLGAAGCQNLNPVLDTAGQFVYGIFSQPKLTYVAGYEYLELDWRGHKAALALGYRDVHPNHVVEHWYSAQGEMLIIKNGRIVGALGTTHELRSVASNAPTWSELAARNTPVVWGQSKDVLPGYIIGLQEFVISQSVAANKEEKLIAGENAQWVLEEVKSKGSDGRVQIYQQKFAIKNDRVIYSEQCLMPDMCFKLRPLGVMVGKS